MNRFVCRILKQLKPIEHKHVRECTCEIYKCYQNNMKYQEQTEYIPYIQCKFQKEKYPEKYILSISCNCNKYNCKIHKHKL